MNVKQNAFSNVHIIRTIKIVWKLIRNGAVQSDASCFSSQDLSSLAVFPILLSLAATCNRFKVEKVLGRSGCKYKLPSILQDANNAVTQLQLHEAAWSEEATLKSLPWTWVHVMSTRYRRVRITANERWSTLRWPYIIFRTSVVMTAVFTIFRINSPIPTDTIKMSSFIEVSLVSLTHNVQSRIIKLPFSIRIPHC